MPKYSYWAAAFGHLASYLVMFVISAVLGAKYYPIPYNWKRTGSYFFVALALFLLIVGADRIIAASALVEGTGALIARLCVGTVAVVAYMAFAYVKIVKTNH